MKRYSVYFLAALVLALVISSFSFGKALATTGCFSDTNGYWAETFICWLKDNGISTGYGNGTFLPNNNITRGEMAVMLKRANAVPPQSGQILFSAGNSNWTARLRK